jgi:hypothetical protein
MTRIYIIDPVYELIVHGIFVESKESASRIDRLWKAEEAARGHELERVILSMKTVRIMERNDPIPVPVFQQLVRPRA